MPLIKEMFAFIVAVKKDEDEGVPAFSTDMGMMPMVGADKNRMESLKPVAQEMANQSGKRVTLVKFSVREDIEVIEPVIGPSSPQRKQPCPKCATLLDAAAGVRNAGEPKTGDITLCIYCRSVLKFDDDMDLQAVPETELQALDQEDRRVLVEARNHLKELHTRIGGVLNGGDGPDSFN